MKNTYLLAAAVVAIAAPSAAMAVTPIAGSFSVSDYYGNVPGEEGGNSNSGLEIDISPLNGGVFSIADLEAGSVSKNLFKISTPEGSVNGDDLALQPIKVDFSFTDPSGVLGSITGNTQGQSQWGGFLGLVNTQSGKVTWNSPGLFNFGNGGQFSITLSDAIFNSGFYGLGKKGATISGTFDLIKASGGVPEPSTWAMMIVGIGFAGAAMRRRQRETVRYNFA